MAFRDYRFFPDSSLVPELYSWIVRAAQEEQMPVDPPVVIQTRYIPPDVAKNNDLSDQFEEERRRQDRLNPRPGAPQIGNSPIPPARQQPYRGSISTDRLALTRDGMDFYQGATKIRVSPKNIFSFRVADGHENGAYRCLIRFKDQVGFLGDGDAIVIDAQHLITLIRYLRDYGSLDFLQSMQD